MLLHPTHDSAKSSPNVHLSCPTKYCLYSCSQLAFFFSPCETLDQHVHRVTFCSPESTTDACIFFVWWSPKFPKQHLFFISFCKQLTPQATTFSHFLCQLTSSSLRESCLLLHDSTYKHFKQRCTSSRILRCVSAKNASSTLSGEVGSKSEFRISSRHQSSKNSTMSQEIRVVLEWKIFPGHIRIQLMC